MGYNVSRSFIVATMANSLGRRHRTTVPQNEAHDAHYQGFPMDEDSSDSGDAGGGNDGDFAETILKSLPSAAAQNDAHGTGNQTHPTNQTPPLPIHSKPDNSHFAGSFGSSFSSAAVQSGAHDAVEQEYTMDHLSPIGQVP